LGVTSGLNSLAPRKIIGYFASEPEHFFANGRTYGDVQSVPKTPASNSNPETTPLQSMRHWNFNH
jgi:hypothetical protein